MCIQKDKRTKVSYNRIKIVYLLCSTQQRFLITALERNSPSLQLLDEKEHLVPLSKAKCYLVKPMSSNSMLVDMVVGTCSFGMPWSSFPITRIWLKSCNEGSG